jgi:dTMP kinase
LIATLTELAVGDTKPNLVILLDLPPEVGLARKQNQNEINRLDAEKLPFHRRVREGYLTLAEQHSDFWVVIDATLPIEQVHKLVLEFVLSHLD